jgi:hypothetical protein
MVCSEVEIKCFVLCFGFKFLGFRLSGTGLPLWEACVVPFGDCEVYSFNGTLTDMIVFSLFVVRQLKRICN